MKQAGLTSSFNPAFYSWQLPLSLVRQTDIGEICALWGLLTQVRSNGYQASLASPSFGVASSTFSFSSCSLDTATVGQSSHTLQGHRLGSSSAPLRKVKPIE